MTSESINRSEVRSIMIVAGEASGDQRAAEVVLSVSKRQPEIQFFGIGGAEMRAAGVETIIDINELAVMGFVEVIKHLPHLFAVMKRAKELVVHRRPDLVILVDYPGFNLRLAKFVKSKGIPVLYYISPQIWAWRENRIKKIAQVVDHMAVVFPFETELYQKYNVPVTYVGHPLVARLKNSPTKESARRALGIDETCRLVTLCPGSRLSVLNTLLPSMVGASEIINRKFKDTVFLIAAASTVSVDDINRLTEKSDLIFRVSREGSLTAMCAADVIITASGTATLEAALLTRPMVVVYKVSTLTAMLARRLLRIPNIALCNVVAGKRVVPEILQEEVTPQNLAEHVIRYFDSFEYRQEVESNLKGVKDRLGDVDAGNAMADLILGRFLKNEQRPHQLSNDAVFSKWPFLRDLVQKARRFCNAKSVVLFGSRARGDFKPTSDFDIAIATDVDHSRWAQFVVDYAETSPTLLTIDFLRLDSVSPEILRSIQSEGVVLYGEKSST